MVDVSNPSYTISAKFVYSAKYRRKAIKGLNLNDNDPEKGYSAEDAVNFLTSIADLCGAELQDIQIQENSIITKRSLF